MSLHNRTISVYQVDIIDGKARHSITLLDPTYENILWVLHEQESAGLEVDQFILVVKGLQKRPRVGSTVHAQGGGHVTVQPSMQIWLKG